MCDSCSFDLGKVILFLLCVFYLRSAFIFSLCLRREPGGKLSRLFLIGVRRLRRQFEILCFLGTIVCFLGTFRQQNVEFVLKLPFPLLLSFALINRCPAGPVKQTHSERC